MMKKREQAGFTLLEALVAMALFSLLMVALTGGLRLGGRIWDAQTTRLDRTQQLQIAQDLLRRTITGAQPLSWSDDPAEPRVAFAGENGRLALAGLLPENLGAGGFRRILIAARPASGGQELVFGWGALAPRGRALLAEEGLETSVLLDGIADIRIDYWPPRRPGQTARWQDHWRDRATLPALLRIQLEFDDPDVPWPELVIPLMVETSSAAEF
ncbi:MAG TPA: prepilin-type N-terminal cleavage/methylation domain-containing protein [Azospirillaceae bacterium]|nr:prepilin-type N-terminal cleavage/methylation domain-containing protein [Azospirillaceae bacterium]